MHSLKTKLIVTISLLVIVLFTLTAFLFLQEKQQELTHDIFRQAHSFAELTAPQIAEDYELYLAQKSFVYFHRELQGFLQKFPDISGITIFRYNGEIVYESQTETEKQYIGSLRKIEDRKTLLQIQARNPSVLTLDSHRTIFLKKDKNGSLEYLDENEKAVHPLQQDEKIAYLIHPATNELIIKYDLSYKNLQSRLNQTIIRGLLLAVFGMGIAVILGVLYAGSITRPLKKLTEGASLIAKGNFHYKVRVKTRDEIATLAKAFNTMGGELEKSTKALVYKERVAKELELAAAIQKDLLPKNIPQVAGLDIAAGLIPAEEIGGDCYDFIQTDSENLLMYLGDVTGHGVPSGIVVSIANALIYNYAGSSDMKSILINVNRILKQKTSSNMFITLVMLNWNRLLQKLTYVSAGHEQMIHYHAKEKKITLVPSNGIALGITLDIQKHLQEESLNLEPGDSLIIYSDGIPESWRNQHEIYGHSRLKRAVNEYSDLPSAMAIRNALLADVKEFSNGYKQMDDITLIVLKRKQV